LLENSTTSAPTVADDDFEDDVQDDGDSAYGAGSEAGTETGTLNSSILRFREENGRTYHSFGIEVSNRPEASADECRID